MRTGNELMKSCFVDLSWNASLITDDPLYVNVRKYPSYLEERVGNGYFRN